MSFFKNFFSIFKNGKEYPSIIQSKENIQSQEFTEIEEDDTIDTMIISEINSDLKNLIDSFKAMNFNLLILNQELKIVFISDLFLKLTDYTNDFLLGKQSEIIIPETLSEREKNDLKGEIGAISSFKKVILPNGENIPAQIYIQVVRIPEEICYTVIIVPLGDRRSF